MPTGIELAADLQMRSLAATCAACHGTDGRTTADDALPALAGRPADELARQLRAFRTGARPGTVMPQLAKGYDDTQIDQLARFFAAQPAAARRASPEARPSSAQRPPPGKHTDARPAGARPPGAAGGAP